MAGVLQGYDVAGTRLRIVDEPGSIAAGVVATELAMDGYGLGRITFEPGDVVVDVGAHVGMVAIWLAVRNPHITVVAIEPEPLNLAHLRTNVAAHGADNVVVVPLALTRDRRTVRIARPPLNSGGAGCYHDRADGYPTAEVRSTTLDAIFDEYVPGRCRLLKVDCEGAEHEILPASRALRRVDWFAGEFHVSSRLAAGGHSAEALTASVARFVDPDRMSVTTVDLDDMAAWERRFAGAAG